MIQTWMSNAPRRNWRDGYEQQITKLPVSFIFLYVVFLLLLLLTFVLGANSIIHFLSAMVYSLAILDQSDFESIGRQMPSGTRVDASLADGTTNTKKRKRRGEYKKKDHHNGYNNDNNNLATVIEGIGNSESWIAALCILIEFGMVEEKRQALAEVRSLAFAAPVPTTTADNNDEAVEVQSATNPVHDEEDDDGDSASLSSTDASL